MAVSSRSWLRVAGGLLLLAVLAAGLLWPAAGGAPAGKPAGVSAPAAAAPFAVAGRQVEAGPAGIFGPYAGQAVLPAVWNGDLRDLPQEPPEPTGYFNEREPFPGKDAGGLDPNWRDPLAQTKQGAGEMPAPIMNFAGLPFQGFGSGWPPDTNGDVGPTYYVETVNTSIGIYDKTTGTRVVGVTFNNFFTGPTSTPCDTSNDGDPVVLYDPAVDRWVITDFAWYNFNTGPYFECIAVSQTNDPVAGGWYFYALQASTGTFATYFNDYPKLGVWSDGWYMSANMFQATGSGTGVRVWALDRASMIAGGAATEVHFDLCQDASCFSLLPSNYRGTPPPAGAPNYFAAVAAPNTLQIWEFHVDWATPANSTLTGPVEIPIADFAIALDGVPQQGTSQLLDTLSHRLMMQLQYRNYGTYEALYATHSIAHEGRTVPRWYEVRNPGGTPVLFQQGTYAPDSLYRWMGAIAADQDGNIALGYSVSSSSMYPSVRYTGQRAGEFPGQMTQGETSLIEGTGSQSAINRWGDYSAMSVDPLDDCTFWYTQEYYATTGSNWQTRIGSFKFPSCGEATGTLTGQVTNAVSGLPVAGAPVTAVSGAESFTAQTDASGHYTMQLLAGTYDVTAGPLLPGYPTPATVTGVVVSTGNTTTQNIQLVPVPYLANYGEIVDDAASGNNNHHMDPGETVGIYERLRNDGAATATAVQGTLSTSTAGVTVITPNAAFPDIAAGGTAFNTTAFGISVGATVPCGTIVEFTDTVTTAQGNFTTNFSLPVGEALPPIAALSNDVEGGAAGWTTGGTQNTWIITTEAAHSPTHSWTDSEGANYVDNTNSWLASPAFSLAGRTGTQISVWADWELEAGYDYVYVEYSTDGGTTWAATPLGSFNGTQATFTQVTFDAAALDNQANAAIRFRLESDGGVVADGIHIDDIAVTYQEYQCTAAPTSVGVAGLQALAVTPAVPVAAVAVAAVLAGAVALVLLRRKA